MRRLLPVLAIAFGALAAPAGAANPWIEKGDPLNIAHQGGEDEFPSNTMYAFRKSLRAGADMLELDIGVTKDGQVVVMHDTTVNGKTNGSGTVASKTLRRSSAWMRRTGLRPRAPTTTTTTIRTRPIASVASPPASGRHRRASGRPTFAYPPWPRC